METAYKDLLDEQQKTNTLLNQLVEAQIHKNKQEARHFWLGLIWHSIPIILTLILLWQIYSYVQTQVHIIQDKFGQIQNDLGTLNFGDKIRSLF
ncbi:MAG: hypothetical protein HY817_03375 [Candidatus Abawacabacteria bacterium]|nr:hypothetical protein [Candidatus Abawacabacteria bacterium]